MPSCGAGTRTCRASVPIHVTGNPRGDMLRPGLRQLLPGASPGLSRREHGDFILVNTNFNHVNAYGPDMNLFKPVSRPNQKARFGTGGPRNEPLVCRGAARSQAGRI